MRRFSHLLVFLAAVLLLSQCARPQTEPGFPHALHLKKIACGGPGQPACVVCLTCHNGLREATERKSVPVSTCVVAGCHSPKTFTPGADIADDISTAAREINFTHNQHLARPGVNNQCVSCHAGATNPDKDRYPPMSTCLTCHQANFDRAKCDLCHNPTDLSKLLPLSFMRHDETWIRHHGAAASASEPICRQCHTEQSCKNCHDTSQSLSIETRRPQDFASHFVHPADFVTRHAIEARSQASTCVRCHAPSTCDSCHVRRGVSPSGFGAGNPHPVGWVGGNTSSPNFHGRAARRELVSCAGCHDQGPATNCIYCHKVGGPGGNPHPRTWMTGRDRSGEMCRYCHGS